MIAGLLLGAAFAVIMYLLIKAHPAEAKKDLNAVEGEVTTEVQKVISEVEKK